MCNDITVISNSRRIFQCLVLFYFIRTIYSKSLIAHDECTKFSLLNDCYYFPCLDAHYSCGRDSHLVKFSYDFCRLSTNRYSSQLTTNAQLYFNHTNLCTMQSLNDQLIERKISGIFTCTHLQAMIFNIYLNCFQNKQRENQMVTIIDFCSIICDNLETMIDLFLNLRTDNVNYINLPELLITTGKSCGAQISESSVHSIPGLLLSICLDRKNVHLKNDITNIMFRPRFEQGEYEWI